MSVSGSSPLSVKTWEILYAVKQPGWQQCFWFSAVCKGMVQLDQAIIYMPG